MNIYSGHATTECGTQP